MRSGLLRSELWYFHCDVDGQPIGPIFKGQEPPPPKKKTQELKYGVYIGKSVGGEKNVVAWCQPTGLMLGGRSEAEVWSISATSKQDRPGRCKFLTDTGEGGKQNHLHDQSDKKRRVVVKHIINNKYETEIRRQNGLFLGSNYH